MGCWDYVWVRGWLRVAEVTGRPELRGRPMVAPTVGEGMFFNYGVGQELASAGNPVPE